MATTGRPGPVFLELPIDVLFARVDEERVVFPAFLRPEAGPAPAPEAVGQLIELLATAERPVILAGGGVWFSGGTTELLEVAERTGTPVVTNGKAQGSVPPDHPLCGGSVSTLAVLQQAGTPPDLVVVLGARLGLFTGGRDTTMLPRGVRIVQVDVAGEEIGRNRDVHLGIVADCRETLRAVAALAARRAWPARAEWQAAMHGARALPAQLFASALTAGAPPIHPFRLAHEVIQAAGPDAVVVADGGETAAWVDMAARVPRGGHWLSHGYLGCLGTGMPFAIAAKVAHPDRPVVCVTGDGSVGLNFAEFDTMVRHGLAIVTVVNNDQQWGMSAHGQELIYGAGRRVVTDLGPTRYDLAAAGFGCHAEHVERPDDLEPALRRALASGRPACVNVMTDPAVVSPLTVAMVGAAAPPAPSSAGERVVMPYYKPLGEG
jgi:thiamine pyrophosphate-dependent acetolactate synthase large subunit-like protein